MNSTMVTMLAGLSIATTTLAEDIDLFIVTGQSNARPAFALGIESGLRASGEFDNVVVYNAQRSGNWLSQWMTDSNGEYSYAGNFLEDLWAPDGSSGLQQLIADLESDGDTVTVRGFFWWQGEGDTGSVNAQNTYSERLQWMISELQGYYGDFDVMLTLIDWNTAFPQSLENIGRTPADVEAIRDALVDAAVSMDAMYFDSRGYPRADLWHVASSDDPRGYYAPVTDLGADQARAFIESVFCPADLNNDGSLDFADVSAFLQLYADCGQ